MRLARPLAAVAMLAAVAACSDESSSPVASAPSTAPLYSASVAGIDGEYIVVLKDGVNARSVASAAGAKAGYVYGAALNGFSARLNAGQLNALQHNPNVAYIQQDSRVQATTIQSGATWGLDRLDQRALPLSGSYSYTPDGTGVNAYIIDTGIRFTHTEFGGRAVSGYDAVDGGAADDCNGHGTHVSGTVGGATYGVAKKVKLWGVRVLDCEGSGTNAGVIAGMDWVTANRILPAVVNMSLGGGASTAVDDATQRMINAGVTVVIAAGNENQNACNVSPSRLPAAITVGATTRTDVRASYSNYGSCVDVFAPGSGITSSWYTSTTATNTIDGTSMASPHVAGVAALYLQGAPSALPATVANAIITTSTAGKVTSAGTGSPNRLLFSPLTVDTSTPTTPTAPCTACTAYTGTLSSVNASLYAPTSTGYTTTVTGVHSGWLQGPSGTDFDLYLEKLSGSTWTIVARGETATSTETVTYTGTAGTYRWRVYSYAGTGAVSFWAARP